MKDCLLFTNTCFLSQERINRQKGKEARWLRAQAAFVEDPGSMFNSQHLHDSKQCFKVAFQGILLDHCTPVVHRNKDVGQTIMRTKEKLCLMKMKILRVRLMLKENKEQPKPFIWRYFQQKAVEN